MACLQVCSDQRRETLGIKIKMAESGRFGKISSAEIERLLDNATSKSTRKSTKFGIKLFDGRHQWEKLKL